MSDLGTGDWVQAIESYRSDVDSDAIVKGCIYQISHFVDASLTCFDCKRSDPGIVLVGHKRTYGSDGVEFCWCLCSFRKWPPPAEKTLVLDEVWEQLKDDKLVRA